jgi:hypothetical protein
MRMRLVQTIIPLTLLGLVGCASDLGGLPPGPGDDDPIDGADAGTGPVDDGRVSIGLQSVYKFDIGSGLAVNDVSGVGQPADLYIADPAAVEWMAGGGLNVIAPTLLATQDPATKIGYSCQASNAITIEAWVRPAATNQAGPARIVTLSGGNDARNFTLAQDNTLLDARVRTTDTDQNGEPATVSDVTAFSGQIVHVAYTRSGLDDEAAVWINGQISGTTTLAGDFSTWDMTYRLGVANELNGERPWRGEIYLVAVYCRDLTPGEVFQNYTAGY